MSEKDWREFGKEVRTWTREIRKIRKELRLYIKGYQRNLNRASHGKKPIRT